MSTQQVATEKTGLRNAAVAALLTGKDERLGILSEAPLVLETPHSLLAGQTITPKPILFVRNIQQLPEGLTLEPLPLADWDFDLAGLIDEPVTIRGEELLEMEQVEHEMVLQCSGNSRSKFSEAYPIKGTAWGQGGVANVRFSGVPLSAVLKKHKIKIDRHAKFMAAEGKDLPVGLEMPDFEHSLPLADALEKSILALSLNGEALPGVHGGPVRLVTPGFYGTMHVKWLRRLRFEQTESTNFYHATEYRVPKVFLKPGEKFKFTLENSIPTWRIRLMSFIFDPQPGATLHSGTQAFSGVAFNDGTARLESLLVSFDRGQTWRQAALQTPASPYAWYPWTIKAELKPGTYEVWSRSVDALGRSQPLDGTIYWNPNGYEWNGVHKIQVTVK
jgi:DMSO/TMAO reductase YedYZ molybdopterin-dependent catalytic subunit